jgi:hypothetical protein
MAFNPHDGISKVTGRVLGAAIAVHRDLGPRLLDFNVASMRQGIRRIDNRFLDQPQACAATDNAQDPL